MALYNLIFIVGVAFVVAQSEALIREPCPCPLIYAPVCGSDSNTYSNECVLNCQKRYTIDLTVAKTGVCDEVAPLFQNVLESTAPIKALSAVIREPCICTREFVPVCGSDGNTYSNKCVLDCEKRYTIDLTVVKDGEC